MDKIDDLKVIATPPASGLMIVSGYSGAADGSGGIYRYSPGTPPNPARSNIIVPNSGTGFWQQLESPALNVRSFGALRAGASAADNRTAINNCLAAVRAAGGGTVYFPPGEYQIDGSIVVPPYYWPETGTRIRLVGDGPSVSVLSKVSGVLPPL